MTTVMSCMMIEAVTYGMMPSANTLSCSSAPPEKKLNSPRKPAPAEAPLFR